MSKLLVYVQVDKYSRDVIINISVVTRRSVWRDPASHQYKSWVLLRISVFALTHKQSALVFKRYWTANFQLKWTEYASKSNILCPITYICGFGPTVSQNSALRAKLQLIEGRNVCPTLTPYVETLPYQ